MGAPLPTRQECRPLAAEHLPTSRTRAEEKAEAVVVEKITRETREIRRQPLLSRGNSMTQETPPNRTRTMYTRKRVNHQMKRPEMASNNLHDNLFVILEGQTPTDEAVSDQAPGAQKQLENCMGEDLNPNGRRYLRCPLAMHSENLSRQMSPEDLCKGPNMQKHRKSRSDSQD